MRQFSGLSQAAQWDRCSYLLFDCQIEQRTVAQSTFAIRDLPNFFVPQDYCLSQGTCVRSSVGDQGIARGEH